MFHKSSIHIAIVGSTGAVGQEIIALLEHSALPIASLKCFASARSLGKTAMFKGRSIPVELLHPNCFADIDFALFSAGREISKKWAPIAIEEGATVIDNSSAFRMNPDVSLIIPEINGQLLLQKPRLISSPNCSCTLMLMVLFPLYQRVKIKRIVAATYQAASGAGALAMESLREEARALLENRPFQRSAFPFQLAFNLFPHHSSLSQNGYVEEELKIIEESKKILNDEAIAIHATCVRVPVFRAHSIALNVSFDSALSVSDAYALLNAAPGVRILEERSSNRFPMPIDAMGKKDVLCGRIRQDPSYPYTLDFWVVGDQLLKGAALNVVQIAEALMHVK